MEHKETAIFVGTKNRKEITYHCLRRLKEVCDVENNKCDLFIFDDMSCDYDENWLSQFSNNIFTNTVNHSTPQLRLVELRRQQLKYFMSSNYYYCYFTDNDCFHHKDFLNVAKSLIVYGEPVGLYHSMYLPKFKLETPFYELNTGTSLFFSKGIRFYNFILKVFEEDMPKWDGWVYKKYRSIGGKFAISEYSMLEHFGKDGVNPSNVNLKKDIKGNIALNLHPDLENEITNGVMDQYYER